MQNQAKKRDKELEDFFFHPEEDQFFEQAAFPAPALPPSAARKKAILEKLLSSCAKWKDHKIAKVFSLENARQQKNLRKKEALLKELMQKFSQNRAA